MEPDLSFQGIYHQMLYSVALEALPAWLLKDETIEMAKRQLQPLERYRNLGATASDEDLWSLYALSRINDFLLFPFTEKNVMAPVWGLRIEFFRALGFEAFDTSKAEAYSPFHHEIRYAGDPDKGSEAIVLGQDWPGLRFGELLFSRAGVNLSAPGPHIDPFVAERSCLFFAYRRFERMTADLSHGWGSNSQWRTAFRRDYHAGGKFHFNVDGTRDLANVVAPSEDRPEPMKVRRENLMHRHLVSSWSDDRNLWPYEDRWAIPDDGDWYRATMSGLGSD